MNTRLKLVPAVAVGAALVLTLAACGGSSSTSGTSGSAGGSGGYNLSFIQGVSGDEFYITMQCGVEAEAPKQGATVNTQAPAKFDPTLQKPIVDSVVAAKPDALLIAPTDVSAMQAPLNSAASAGIKVVLVDTTVNDPSFAVSSISSDNEGGGTAAFGAIKDLNPDGGKIMVMSTDPGISTLDARVKGFEDAARADSSFEYLGVQYSRNDPAEAARLINAALAKDPDIVGVFATNTFAAAGTGTGVRQSGKQDQVKVVGFDAGPDQVNQLKDGTVQALIAQDPYQIGIDAVDQAVASLKGTPTEQTIQTGFHVLTADNIDGDGAQYVYKSSC